MQKNRYFTGRLPQADMAKIQEVICGNVYDQLTNTKGNLIGIKLALGDTATHSCLNSFKEYTHNEYLTIIRGEEWQQQD